MIEAAKKNSDSRINDKMNKKNFIEQSNTLQLMNQNKVEVNKPTIKSVVDVTNTFKLPKKTTVSKKG